MPAVRDVVERRESTRSVARRFCPGAEVHEDERRRRRAPAHPVKEHERLEVQPHAGRRECKGVGRVPASSRGIRSSSPLRAAPRAGCSEPSKGNKCIQSGRLFRKFLVPAASA
jgi:hypothetical protein